MTDRELLELAAKAAGIVGDYFAGSEKYTQGIWRDGENDDRICWNPLTNDGDALRLAVKLHINITCAENFSGAKPFYGGKGFDFPTFDGPDEATRRAIVRAAAEIGKGIK